MDFFWKIWEMVFLWLVNWNTGCGIRILCKGVLHVNADPVVLMGSNLTVLCRSYKEHCGQFLSIYLNQQIQKPLQVLNCSTVRLNLAYVSVPKSQLICKVNWRGDEQIVCGKNIQSGCTSNRSSQTLTSIVELSNFYKIYSIPFLQSTTYVTAGHVVKWPVSIDPPDKPTKFRCLAPRDSNNVNCTWEKGKETHIPTNYTVTFEYKNGTQFVHLLGPKEDQLLVPWYILDVNGVCTASVRAKNDLGESVSDHFPLSMKDIVIPNAPKITNVTFGNSFQSATLHWELFESSETLRTKVRLRETRAGTFWVEKDLTESSRGVVMLENLEPFTQYEFQMQVCTVNERSKCSMWSSSVYKKSPGKAPSKKLDVWLISRNTSEYGTQTVTVLWKPFTLEDYQGTIINYEIIYEEHGQKQIVTCAADVKQCTLWLSHGVKTALVSTVTPVGNSPPASLTIMPAGLPAPRVRLLASAGEDGAFLTWDKYAHQAESVECYIVQWQSNATDVRWKRLPAEQNNTYVEGLEPGIRFNISLFAVFLSGYSEPASSQVYSKEKVPLSGPKVSVLRTEKTRIRIQWEELPLDQQRGFITKYTIYVRKCNSVHHLQKLTVAVSGSRQMWLDDLKNIFDVCISASNSAGEGPVVEAKILLQCSPEGGVFSSGIFLAVIIPAVVVVNLVCWSCIRKRIRNACITLGPQWLFENFPKVENSTATKLLQENDSSDCSSSWISISCDPPITPLEVLSASEGANHYPPGCLPDSTNNSAVGNVLPVEPGTNVLLIESHGYKPQISPAALEEEVPEQEEGPFTCDTTSGSEVCEFLRDWLWDVSQERYGACLNASINPSYNPQAGGGLLEERQVTLGPVSEDSQHGLTLQPDDVVSCLQAIALGPAKCSSYFPQGIILRSAPSNC